MTISSGLLLFALGAILRFAVTAEVAGLDIATVGTILMVTGAVIAFIGLILMTTVSSRRRTDVYETRSPDGSRIVREQVEV